MPLSPFTIWTDPARTRYFLLPDSLTPPQGSFAIRAPLGKRQSVDPESVLLYELTEQQAKVWVASEITGLLQALPKEPARAGEKIMAAAHLVRQLPDLIRLSTNPKTLTQARELGAALDQQLAAAGIESCSAFSQLPARIATIQGDPAIQDKRQEVASELRRISEQIEIPAVRRFLEEISKTIGENFSNN